MRNAERSVGRITISGIINEVSIRTGSVGVITGFGGESLEGLKELAILSETELANSDEKRDDAGRGEIPAKVCDGTSDIEGPEILGGGAATADKDRSCILTTVA
jgi:hypothetical protein